MKRVIYRNDIEEKLEQIQAMSTINPRLCKNCGLIVEVEERDEGPIPHLHVYHDKTRDPRKCSYIRLDKAEYSDHHSRPSLPLPNKKAKQAFIQIMTSPWSKANHFLPDGTCKIATGYEAAVDTWVECYEDDDYSKFTQDEIGNLVMPDYSKL